MRQNSIRIGLFFSAWILSLSVLPYQESDSSKSIPGREFRGHGGAVTDVRFSPEGRQLVSSSLDGTIRWWEVATGQLIKTTKAHGNEVYAVKVSRDGHWIVSTGYDRQIIVQDFSGEVRRRITGFHGWTVDIALSPDSRRLAGWSMDGDVRVWDLESGGSSQTLQGTKWKWGMALAWSPKGRYLACGRVAITIWDMASGAIHRNLEAHRGFVRDLAFSPDGRRLASAGLDKSVRVWDVLSGNLLFSLQPEGFVHYTANGPVTNPIRVPVLAVDFSPDGSRLATGGADRVIRIWDATTGRLLRSLMGHTMSVTAVAFSPCGDLLASASLDHTIRLWEAAAY